MSLIRSISGLRGFLGKGLTPHSIARHVVAFAEYTGYQPIVIGRDGRPSGEWIEQIVIGTLIACGVKVSSLGIVPTPTVQMAVEKSDAAGGISITASHNPAEWNGLKFLNSEGVFLGSDECSTFYALADGDSGTFADYKGLGTVTDRSSFVQTHLNATLALPFLQKEAIPKRKFSVVVDAVNASGSFIVPELLHKLGCSVIPLHCDGSGEFPHTPEPLPVNLTSLCDAVRETEADFGIAVDPDADRLVLIDERGEPIGEEYTITLITDFMMGWEREEERESPIGVVNLSTTRAVEDVAARYGGRIVRTAVGEINVVERMKKEGAVIGGEGSGGVILPALHYGRDSLAGIAITLAALLKYGGTLSELRASLPNYVIVKKKVPLDAENDPVKLFEEIRTSSQDAVSTNSTDGLRVDFEKSWVHLRTSNTEPILRIIAEAPTREEAEELAARYEKMVVGNR
ncbi:MAG: phosphoglucosamine mutase [Ignavibacteriae bacterium]|nr:phosphoglucosamine mutase [Ignavibacteriota bacterium]MCB9217416.1 phosphoglucosamine mutase [Ignavibacteria bacterium]